MDKVLTGGFGPYSQKLQTDFVDEFNLVLEKLESCLKSDKVKQVSEFQSFKIESNKTVQFGEKQYTQLNQEDLNRLEENDRKSAFDLDSLEDIGTDIMIKRLVLCQKMVPQLLITLIDFISSNKFVNQTLINRCVRVICLIGTHLDQIHVEIFSEEVWYHLLSYFDRRPDMVARLIRTLVKNSEAIFHITPRFFNTLFDLFMKKFDVFSKNWSLDQSNQQVKLQDLYCLSDMMHAIESIVDCVPEKWNRQAFDLIVGSNIADFVIETCLDVVKDQDLIDYERIQFNQDHLFFRPQDKVPSFFFLIE
jgi:hypothetical protein